MLIDGVECWFCCKPMAMGIGFKVLKPFVPKQKALLYWKIGNVRVSYGQIKEALTSYLKVHPIVILLPS